MKLSQFTFALAILLAFVIGQSLAVSDEEKDKPSLEDIKRKMHQERIMKIRSPGKYHEMMKWYEGTWDVEWRFAMYKEMPPIKVVSEFKWIIDGRWMSEELKAETAIPGMGKMHQFLIHGYDNHTKNFVSCGVNNMDTSMNMFRGVQVDPKDEVFTQYGTINEWLDDTFNKPVKVVVRKIDEDTFESEIWDLQIGEKGQAVIAMKYKRRK